MITHFVFTISMGLNLVFMSFLTMQV